MIDFVMLFEKHLSKIKSGSLMVTLPWLDKHNDYIHFYIKPGNIFIFEGDHNAPLIRKIAQNLGLELQNYNGFYIFEKSCENIFDVFQFLQFCIVAGTLEGYTEEEKE